MFNQKTKTNIITKSLALSAVMVMLPAMAETTTTQYQTEQTTTSYAQKPATNVSDQAIRESMDAMIDGDANLDDDVSFTVKDGVVTLNGTVDTPDELKKAETESYKIKGVTHVVNKLSSETAGMKAQYPSTVNPATTQVRSTSYSETVKAR